MSKLCSNAANCGLKKIQNALPESLKTKVVQSLNITTYVFVMKNIEQAKKLLKFLEDKGFSNISIDSKGTTITTQSQSANNDSGTLGCQAIAGFEGICSNYGSGSCYKWYSFRSNSINRTLECINCKWSDGKCQAIGCNNCPPVLPP